MTNRRAGTAASERGFALVLAILSLMLLTFLGLTLATTTSTELQIATNYRWSQQALYNAEAGLEAGRLVLARVAGITTQWADQLPLRRVGPDRNEYWFEDSAPEPMPSDLSAATGRDFEKSDCDGRAGIGYGRILVEGGTRYEDLSDFDGRTLNGTFTVWIRRGLTVDNLGQYSDETSDAGLIIVSEGRAPFVGPVTGAAAARQAVRVLETTYSLGIEEAGDPCENYGGQEGVSPTGENFNACAPIGKDGTALQAAFGGTEAGTLESTEVE